MEEQQVHAYDRAAIQATVASMLRDVIKRMKEESKRGPLHWQQVRVLKVFARRFPEAQDFLQRCSQSSSESQKNNLPPIPTGAAKPFRRA
jgi:hypothetical protein